MAQIHRAVTARVKKHIEKKAQKHANTTKTIKIKHHHTKPYRKRHYGSLALFLILSASLITWLIIYRDQVTRSVNSAQSYLSDVFNPEATTTSEVSSTYGYSLSYDIRTFNASAIDAATGDLFIGEELSTKRPYQTVRLSTGLQDTAKGTERSLTISYFDDVSALKLDDRTLSDQERNVAMSGVDLSKNSVSILSTKTEVIGGKEFAVHEWSVTPKDTATISAKVKVEFRTYASVLNGKAIILKLTYGLSKGSNREVFGSVLKTMTFGSSKQAKIVPSKQVREKTAANLSLLDTILMTRLASADAAGSNTSEEVSSRYSPAVVKIYNVYCMDIKINNTPYLSNICSGSTGSGFFVTENGNIATNGHVASADPLDIVIQDAVAYLIAGNSKYFESLAALAGVNNSDFTGKETDVEIIDIAVNKMYAIDPSKVVAYNNVQNLLVGLNDAQPDLKELVAVTKNRKEYAEQDSVKKAKFVAKDYRVIDGISSFKASDVALIKVEGSNYPVTKLGKIDGVSQGANILIFGYPGGASNNGLVENNVSKPTLTAGKVSAMKTANGSGKKLIETDATIGHGNSGGPVLNDAGEVVGIATYTIDGSGKGNGVYNYIRDIQDFKDIATKSSVSITGKSATQAEWDKGIDNFYKAHYSKAVKSFEKVKKLYPAHPKVSELLATANDRIKNGQDVKDFPFVLVGAGVASVLGVAVSGFVIFRHRRAHKVYTGQVASGAMQPMMPGAQPQMVTYNRGAYYAGQMQQGVQPNPAVAPAAPQPAYVTPPAPQVVAPNPPGQQPPKV